MNKTTKP